MKFTAQRGFLVSLLFLLGSVCLAQTYRSDNVHGIDLDYGATEEHLKYDYVISVRPFSSLVYPLSFVHRNLHGASVAMPNLKIEKVLNKRMTVGLEGNVFLFEGDFSDFLPSKGACYSLRLDYQFYFVNMENPKEYAEGFHLGPYFMFRYVTNEMESPSEIAVDNSFYGGVMFGKRLVGKRLLLDPHLGFGLRAEHGQLWDAFDIRPFPHFKIGCALGLKI